MKEQEECDNNVASLAAGLGDMLPMIEATTSVAKLAMLKDTIGDMLKLVEDASLFIIEYKSNGAAGKSTRTFRSEHSLTLQKVNVARAFVSSTAKGQVDEFVSQLSDLKEKFDRGMVTQVVQHVDTLLGDGRFFIWCSSVITHPHVVLFTSGSSTPYQSGRRWC